MADVARLVIRVSSDTSAAIRSLETLNARLQSFAASNNGVNDSMNRSSSSARTWAERLAETARESDNSTNANNRHTSSHRTLQQAFTNSGREARLFGVSISTIGVGVLALSPVFTVALGYLGGLTSMLGSAGVALGAFGLAFLALGRQGRAEVLEPLTAATQRWGQSLEAVIAKPINTFAQVLNQNLSQLNPLVNTASEALNRGASALGNFLKTDEFKAWLAQINQGAKEMLPALGSAFGDVMRGIMNLIVAFLPLAQQMAQGFANWAAKFREWSSTLESNPSFQHFLQFVQQNGPRVMEIIGNIAEAAVKLIIAMSPLGMKILEAANAVAQFINGASPQKLEQIATAIGLIFLAFKGASVIQGVAGSFSSLVSVMGTLGPIGTLVVGALLLLAGYVIYLITHSDHLQSLIKSDLLPALQEWWGKMQELERAIRPIAEVILSALIPAIAGMITVTAQVLGALAGFLNWLLAMPAHFSAIGSALTTAWNATWNGIQTAAQTVWNALQTAWDAVCNAFSTAWQAVSGALSSAWSAVWNALSAAGQAIWNAMQTAWNAVCNAFSTVWQAVSGALTSAWNAVWNALSAAGQAIWNAMQTAWNTICNAFSTVWTAVSGALTAAWNAVWNALSAAGQAIWNAMQTAWNTICGAFTTVWNAVSSTLSAAWNTVWNGIKTIGEGIWNGIKTVWQTTVDTLKSIWDKISEPIKGAFKSTWDAVKSTAESIWNGIKTAVRDGVNGVIDLVNGLIGVWDTVTGAVGLDSLHVDKLSHVSFATGGYVTGPGTSTSDSIPARLSNGEYVINAAAVSHYGVDAMNALNSRAFASGGLVGSAPSESPTVVYLATGGQPDPNTAGRSAGGTLPSREDVQNQSALATGPGGDAKSLLDIGVDAAKMVLGFIGATAIHAIFDPFVSLLDGVAGKPGQIAAAGFKKIENAMIDLFIKKDEEAKPKIGGQIPEGQHLAIIQAAMLAAGVPPPDTVADWEAGLNTLITRESGWNAGAINNTDSNAQAGIPSQGLAQVIPPTFAAYHVPGTSDNILDPVANVAAAIRYIVARYGSILNVQQANANLPPAGYWRGTKWARRGWAKVGEDGPEWVNFSGGEGVKRNGETPWDWTKRDRIGAASDSSGTGDIGEINIHIHGPVTKDTLPKLKTEFGDALRMSLQCKSGSK